MRSALQFRTTEPVAGAVPAPGSLGRLLVLLSDPLTDIVRKGAIVPRYYNPCNVFSEVHFLLLNGDRPPEDALRLLVGDARPVVHNMPLPERLFVRSLGWQPWAMTAVVEAAAGIVAVVGPQLIRPFCTSLNALIGAEVGRRLEVPVLTSLHNHPEVIVARDRQDWVRQRLHAALAARALRRTDHVIAIYGGQLPYLNRLGVRPYLAYNVLSVEALQVKAEYRVGERVRLISVGRHMPGKSLAHLAEAVACLAQIDWTIVGGGPLRGELEHRVRALGIAGRTQFEADWTNEDLCRRLREFDIFAANNDYPGIPKAVMEPMLVGLPVVVNRKTHEGDDELMDAAIEVDDTPVGYRAALARLVGDEAERRRVGAACRQRAMATWEPVAAEERLALIHASVSAPSKPSDRRL
jgi:glycosyltransferase involved in cell wall biosynthesis